MPTPFATPSFSEILALQYTPKVLGQAKPVAATLTDLYTVPASTEAEGQTLTVANQAAAATAFRVAISVGGGVIADKDYIYFDIAIPANETFAVTGLRLGLSAGDKVRVYNTLATLSFMLSGWERPA